MGESVVSESIDKLAGGGRGVGLCSTHALVRTRSTQTHLPNQECLSMKNIATASCLLHP